jgi:hypothetical protein
VTLPDKRSHRGRHPEDARAFDDTAIPRLREAVHDLSWLLSRGYADKSALKLVGDRFNLLERQRIAVMRCACSDAQLAGRRGRQVDAPALAGTPLILDGYNVLTTVEAALAGGIVLEGRDGCYRDMASMHGTFRQVVETRPAIRMLGEVIARFSATRVVWYLDRPVSNSGRLRGALLQLAEENHWAWEVELVPDPDRILAVASEIVATADSAVLDRCGRWFGLAREAVDQAVPGASILRLAGRGDISLQW